ncbi:hypothetical protein VA596_01465 [Amycolatopsis sp., V23-08]|uniref:PH domain-containing protein n=1 Tax=Amycolatopsis heterodermiae TaxID=3110235 RepID=A0ABU5QXN8_9PSEU|nr:hypothetical protein [Amycolatopsis sp., V23-08]MEA5358189.1 hypothetical protein [Amycolatopsis sp., V23-08]
MDLPTNVLLPGERLLWSGRPRHAALDGHDWYRLVFGLVWVSLVLGFPLLGRGSLLLVSPIFAAFGLAIAWGPVVLRQRTLRRAVYAVTDRRVVVADRVSGRIRASAYLGALPPPVVRAGRNGVGAVAFGSTGGLLGSLTGAANPGAFAARSMRLVGLPDAGYVRDLIAQAQARLWAAG